MLILHCKTTCCYQMTSPSTSITLEALTTLYSIIQSGLIPGGKSVRKEMHAGVLHSRESMFIDQHTEVEYDLTNPRIPVYKKHWISHQNTVYWCNLKVAQKKGLQFYQIRSNAIILHNTLLAMCIEKVENMKSGEELHNKVCQAPRLPRKAVLTPNLHHGRQELSNLEARTSTDHQSKQSEMYGETRCDINSYRGTEEFWETEAVT